MKKIPTIFERDWDNPCHPIIPIGNHDCAWVFSGEGMATRKYDGTSCLVENGKLWKRRELKPLDVAPADFKLADIDNETGKRVGWVPVGDGPEDKFHREAFDGDELDGTYELIGPKIQGNAEKEEIHTLLKHEYAERFPEAPREFKELSLWLSGRDIEGLVWHHPNGSMAKIKLRDFNLKRA